MSERFTSDQYDKKNRFRPDMSWSEYFTEINKLCEELNDISEHLKKQEKNDDDTPKR
jgi:hypothetical protein